MKDRCKPVSSSVLQNGLIIDLLRHGETTAGKCFLGSTDAPLNETGWQQMRDAQLDSDYQRVISSPLLRCETFARQFSEENSIPLQLEKDLREIHFGEWEGETAETLWQTQEQELSMFWSDPLSYTPPGAETIMDFQQRVLQKFSRLSSELEDEKVLLVCHAGVIKIILCEVLGMNLASMHRLSLDHGGVSRLSLWENSLQAGFINR